MITRRTRLQLLVFVVITLLGVSYVGARYARLDRVFFDDHYTVVAHFARVRRHLRRRRGLLPRRPGRPGRQARAHRRRRRRLPRHRQLLRRRSRPTRWRWSATARRSGSSTSSSSRRSTPRRTSARTPRSRRPTPAPRSRPRSSSPTSPPPSSRSTSRRLRTTVDELGQAFAGTGEDLQRIIDTGNSFLETADDNFDVTTALIRDSNTVLQDPGRLGERDPHLRPPAAASSAARWPAPTRTLRQVIDDGSATATQLRTFLEDNQVDLGELINNLVTTGDVIVKHLPGIEQILVIYPYVVEGGFTVVSKSPDTGLYDAHFGLILTNNPVCHHGYESTDTRPPQDGSNRPMNTQGRLHRAADRRATRAARRTCRAPAPPTGAAGRLLRPRHAAGCTGAPASTPTLAQPGTLAPPTFGEDSWKWLFLQPLTKTQRVTDHRPTRPRRRRRRPAALARFRLVLLGVLVRRPARLRRRPGLAARRAPRRGRRRAGRARGRDVADRAVRAAAQHLRTRPARRPGPPARLPEAGRRGDHAEVRHRLREVRPADRRADGRPGRLRPHAPRSSASASSRSTPTPRPRSSPPASRGSYPDPKHPDDADEAGRDRPRRAALGGRAGQGPTAPGWSTTTRPVTGRRTSQ